MAIGSGSILPWLTSISTSARAGSVAGAREAGGKSAGHQERLRKILHQVSLLGIPAELRTSRSDRN